MTASLDANWRMQVAVLQRLAAFMADDVAAVLMEIADDIRRNNAQRKAA